MIDFPFRGRLNGGNFACDFADDRPLSFQSIERIPEKSIEEDEEREEEESKFCTLPRSNNGFTIRQVSDLIDFRMASMT